MKKKLTSDDLSRLEEIYQAFKKLSYEPQYKDYVVSQTEQFIRTLRGVGGEYEELCRLMEISKQKIAFVEIIDSKEIYIGFEGILSKMERFFSEKSFQL